MSWKTRKHGSRHQIGSRFLDKKGKGKGQVTVAEVLAAKRNPSFSVRPIYTMDGGKVRQGVLKDGQVLQDGSVDKIGSERRGYQTAQATCPDLTPSKAVQRQELASHIDGGTVLETHAGKGNLSAAVYAKNADKVVLVEKNKTLLNRADEKLDGKVKHESICQDNVKCIGCPSSLP